MSQPSQSRSSRWALKSVVFQLLMLGGLVASGLSLISFLGAVSPAIDLFSHFRWQYTALLFALAVIAWLGKKRKYATTFSITSAISAMAVAVLCLPPAMPPLPGPSATLTLLDMNVFYGNDHYDSVAQEINRYDADLVLIEELSKKMLKALEPSLKRYPYRVVNCQTDCWGIGLFSKRKLENCNDNLLNLPVSYVISADLNLNRQLVTVEAIHTVPQYSRYAVGMDARIIQGLTAHNHGPGKQVILAGDFNATPWSELFRQLDKSGDFSDSEQGFGMQLSWPVGVPWLSLPIDHCLYTSHCRTLERHLGDAVGSDHLPLYIKLSIAR